MEGGVSRKIDECFERHFVPLQGYFEEVQKVFKWCFQEASKVSLGSSMGLESVSRKFQGSLKII